MTSRKSTSSSPHDSLLAVEYDDAERARRVERSLRPEVGDRSRIRMAREGATLEVAIAAADLVALRAGLNTWLTLVSVAEAAGDAVR